jgi:hypothetical protein
MAWRLQMDQYRVEMTMLGRFVIVQILVNVGKYLVQWVILGALNQEELVFIGLAYQGKDIMFRFIIEYSSLMDFGL